MKREVGLWIDQHKTVMVTVVNEKEETREIRSNIEKPVKLSGGSAAKKKAGASPTMHVAQELSDHRNGYYDGVVSLLRTADSILIFGPGEAKVELKKRLELVEMGGRIVCIESQNKMTDRQIVAKVRQHYDL